MSSPPSSPGITTNFSEIADFSRIADVQDPPRTSSQFQPASGELVHIPSRGSNRQSGANAFRSSTVSLAEHQQKEALFNRNAALALKRLAVDVQMLGAFRVDVLEHHLRAWAAILERPTQKRDLDELDELIGVANKAQTTFSRQLRIGYDKLRDDYRNTSIDDGLKAICVQATLRAQANMARLIDVASFVTSMRYEVHRIYLASRSLFDMTGKPAESFSSDELSVYLKKIEEVANKLHKKRQTLNETPQPLRAFYDSCGLVPDLNIMTTQADAMTLREKFLQAAIGKGLDSYRRILLTTGESPETSFLRKMEQGLDLVIGYAKQSLSGAQDRVALSDALIRHPNAKAGRSTFRLDRHVGKGLQTQATTSIVRAHSMTLVKTVALVAPK